MGKRTEFNLRTVPMLFGVIDEKVTRGDLLVDILRLALKFEEQLELCRSDEAVNLLLVIKKLPLRPPMIIMIMT